jgi:gentisate 1,2-dioxygenase
VTELAEAPIAFRWEDTLAALDAEQARVGEGAPASVTLGPAQLDTIALRMMRIPAGVETASLHDREQHLCRRAWQRHDRGGRADDGMALRGYRGDPAWRPFTTTPPKMRCFSRSPMNPSSPSLAG